VCRLEVTYTTTLDDYVTLSLHMLRRSWSACLTYYFSWLGVPTICLIVTATLVSYTDMGVAAILTGTVGMLHAVFYPAIRRVWVAGVVRGYAKDFGSRGVIGRITLMLSDTTFVEVTETTRSEAQWRDMKRIEVVGDSTYIYVTGLSTAIVPRHGFDRDEDYFATRDFALAKLGGQA
jgi:hypothetical protein